MKRLLVMAIFALVFITTSAQAADKGMYVSGIAGLSLVPKLDQEISGTRVFKQISIPVLKLQVLWDMILEPSGLKWR